MKPEAFQLMEDLDRTHWWYRARREVLCSLVARHVPPGSEIVDFGSGMGATAVGLRDLGYQVVAADRSGDALEVCRERGLPTIDLNHEWLPPGGTDCVLACDVLEHVEDDVGLLIRLRAALRPNGRLIATVPAYEWLWSGEDYVSEHVRRYTRKSLKRHLQGAGFRALRCSYFNTILFPLIVAVILSKRLFRPRDMYRSNIEAVPGWENAILTRLFALEAPLLRSARFPFGMSLVVIACPEDAGATRDEPAAAIAAVSPGA